MFEAVVLAVNAWCPIAVLAPPVVVASRDNAPTATLLFPEVRAAKALLPIAIASPPV